MQIEIYSDVICPWCFIGKRRLERARAMRPDIRIDVRWRAFQLNPWMPPEGMSRADYLVAKFGAADAGRVYGAIQRVGLSEGVDFAFDRIARTPNTIDAHRLIRWAADAAPGRVDDMVDALFTGYFLEGRDLGDRTTLVQIAEGVGLDPAAAGAFLASGAEREAVQAEDAGARQLGVQGVPCFIMEKRYAVSGAQEPEYFMPLFDLAERAPVSVGD